MTSDKREWREAMHQRLDEMLDELEKELLEDASLASIEQALLEQEKAFMSDTFQILADRQELSPLKSRAIVKNHPQRWWVSTRD